MNIGHLEMAIELLLLLRLLILYMGELLERSAHPSPDHDKSIDYRPHFIRGRDLPPPSGKATYDVVAEERLHRIEERRRQKVPDNGLRRRKTDR